MNFGFTQEQQLLKEQASRFVRERWPLSEVRRLLAGEVTPQALRSGLAELGFFGLLVPETHGGVGLSWVEAIVLLEATGAGLLPGPLASSLVASAIIAEFAAPSMRTEYLPSLASAERVATAALLEDDAAPAVDALRLRARRQGDGLVLDGEKLHVHDVCDADLFVTAARDEHGLLLVLLSRALPGLQVEAQPTIDRTKRMGRLQLRDVRVPTTAILAEGERAEACFSRLCDLSALALSAEMLGAASAVHALTVEYAKQRTQFGRPIGQYQGVKHPLAEMHVDIETCRSLVYYAAWVANGSPQGLPRAASMAKAYASDAFARIGVDAIQLHGAIGYTAEYDAQLFLKRAKWARVAFGDAEHHYERIARLWE